jgi:Ca2+-binding RTX toxin-like protein
MKRSIATLFATLAVAAPASAGEISVQGGVLRIDGGTGYLDADVYKNEADYSVTDYGQSLEPGDGCTLDTPEAPVVGPLNDRTMTCKGVTVAVEATVGAEDNFLVVDSDLPKRLRGGAGRDLLLGYGSGPTEATGGAGEDSLTGGTGKDTLDGGAGTDRLRGGGDADRLLGGEGEDTLQGDDSSCCIEGPEEEAPKPAGTADLLDGGAGGDTFTGVEPGDLVTGGDGRDTVAVVSRIPVSLVLGAGGLDVENVNVEEGDATVRADGRANDVATGKGKDDIDPGAGFDKVLSGAGDDTVSVRDAFPDYVDCGEGADRVVADAQDEVDATCEAVDRAAPAPPASGGPAAPALISPSDLKVSVKRKGRRVTLRGLVVLPAGTNPSLCKGGGVTLEIKGVMRKTVRRGTVLDARCRFTSTLKGTRKRRKVRVKGFFAGTPQIAPIGR